MKEQQKVKDKEENRTKWDIWHVPKRVRKRKRVGRRSTLKGIRMKESAVDAMAVLQLCSKWNKVSVSSFRGWVYRSLQQTYKYMQRQSIVNVFTETVELGVLVPYPEEGNEARDQRLPSVLKNKEWTLKKTNGWRHQHPIIIFSEIRHILHSQNNKMKQCHIQWKSITVGGRKGEAER